MRCRAVSSHEGLDAVRSPNRFGGSDLSVSRGDRSPLDENLRSAHRGFRNCGLAIIRVYTDTRGTSKR
jgi:hypothetical protein